MKENRISITAGMQAAPEARKEQTLTGPEGRYQALRKSIRSYGVWMIVSAVISFIPSFDLWWAGIVLLLGLMSFYFSDVATMLLLYATTFLLAAVSNLFSQDGRWIVLALFQVWWGIAAFLSYRAHRHTKADYEASQSLSVPPAAPLAQRETQLTWLALLLGLIGLTGLCGGFAAAIGYSISTGLEPADMAYAAIGTSVEVGLLAVPIGAAALTGGYKPRAAALAALVLGAVSGLALILFLIIALVAG